MHSSLGTVQFDFIEDDLPEINVPLQSLRVNDAAPGSLDSARLLQGSTFCDVEVDAEYGALWVWLKADSPAKFTPTLLDDLRSVQDRVATRLQSDAHRGESERLHYQVFASRIPKIFSLGGDLALFRDRIRKRDVRGLRTYAREAVDLLFTNATAYEQPITTISLIQGQALGGGFEAALAANVLVAERQSKMGFPEVLFNMFPGMGAFQLLSRKVSPAEAERMILSGRTYTAEELHAIGIVDVLADTGQGRSAVEHYIRSNHRQNHAHLGFRSALRAARPLDKHELYRMADVWAETAMGLGERDLVTIDYLLRAQQRMEAGRELEQTPAQLLKKA